MKAILLDRLVLVKKKISRLNKKAANRGLPLLKIITGNKFRKSITVWIDKEPATVIADFIEVFIEGELPPLPGFVIAGWIDEREGNRLIWGDVPDDLRHADMYDCDHCHTTRNRKTVAVIRDAETSRMMIVGKSCFHDYFGAESAETLISFGNYFASFLKVLDDQDDYLEDVGNCRVTDVVRFLGLACDLVTREGYRGAQNDQNRPSTGLEALSGAFNFATPSAQGMEMACKVSDFFMVGAGSSKTDNYTFNVRSLLKAGYVSKRGANTLASAVQVYVNSLEKPGDSEYVGVVGERVELTLTLSRVCTRESDFGLQVINIFRDESGNSIVWRTSRNINVDLAGGSVRRDLQAGETVKVRATIGEHRLYEHSGRPPVKTTYLKRLKVLSLVL